MQFIQEVNQKKTYSTKVLQVGEGNFLRAFVDWIIHTMNQKTEFNGGVTVIQPIKHGMVDKLNEQNGLYTLYLNGIKNGEVVSEHEVIDVIDKGINPYSQYEDYIATAENPELRFVISNTTEAGITFDEKDQLTDQPQHSFPGKMTALLYHRYKTFHGDEKKGLIFIPCELIDKNGAKLKEIILRYARLWNLEEGFIQWIEEANTFCNSLVDRIVPGYPREKIEDIKKELGYEDGLVVEGEQFHLWVIEGPQWVKEEFPADQAGLNVLFVDDLTPYRTRKVRILNGAHTSMVPVAYLYGKDTVREAVEDEVTGKFIKETIFEEIIPTLDLPVEELEGFANAVIDRFKNPFIKHYLMSISLNSMSKYETRVLPSVLEYVNRKGKLPKRLVFALASFMVFYRGERNGESIQLTDDEEILALYKNLWSSYDGSEESLHNVVVTVLSQEKIWKMNLNEVTGLTEAVKHYLKNILDKGMVEAIQEVIA